MSSIQGEFQMKFRAHMDSFIYGVLVVSVMLMLNSCGGSDPLKSGKVSEGDLFRAYSLTYDESQKSTMLLAQFYEKTRTGSSVILEQPSTIVTNDTDKLFVGQSPRALSGGSGGYQWTSSLAPVTNVYTMNWTTPTGRLIEDQLKLPTPVRPLLAYSSFSRTSGVTLRFDRDLDVSGMTVRANIKGTLDGSAVSANVTAAVTSGGNIQFFNSDLQRFALGTIYIDLQTETETTLPAAVSGGVTGVATSIFQLTQLTTQLTP
jgi:hypothetical protein